MSAKSMCDKISYTQGHELFLALVRAGLTPEIAQEVINSKGNKKAKAMVAAVWQESKKDDRFRKTMITRLTWMHSSENAEKSFIIIMTRLPMKISGKRL